MKEQLRPRLLADYVDLGFNSLYLVFKLLITIVITGAIGMDFYYKFEAEMQLHSIEVAKCRH